MNSRRPIFADNHSTTPIDPVVLRAFADALAVAWGNPSSAHAHGREAARYCEWGRRQVAEMLGGNADDVTFTSGATEANNLALKGALRAQLALGRDHIVTTAIEHSSVLEVCKILAGELGGMGGANGAGIGRMGAMPCRVTVVSVGRDGIVDPMEVRRVLTPRTALVSVMGANNEVGTIQPVEAIAQFAHDAGALMHVDACQSFGRVPLQVVGAGDTGADLVTISAHKMYGPKGIGALYIAPTLRVRMAPEIAGGIHEKGLRAGTVNAPAAYALGVAVAEMARKWPRERTEAAAMREALWYRVQRALGPERVRWNGTTDFSRRLPGNLNFTLVNVCPHMFTKAIEPIVSLSGAAACKGVGASHVLKAMGVGGDAFDVDERGEKIPMAAVRIGLGRFNDWSDVDAIADAVVGTAKNLYGSGCPTVEKERK